MKKSLLFFIACAFMAVNSYSQWNLTGNSNATSTSVLGTTNAIPLSLVTKNTKRLVIDTLGRVGIGIASPINILTVKGAGSTPAASWVSSGSPLFVGFGETTPGNADFNLALASATVNARGVIGLKRSRGTLAVPAAVVANDQLGSVLVSGFDGANFQGSAAVDFFADGAPTVGNVPARISFVTGSNSSNRAERLKIASNGDIFINNTQLTVTNATGNVGVGTNTFLNGEKFAIKQNGLQLGVYPGYLDNVANSGYTTLEMPGVNTLRIWDNLSVSDNVGIGTASPTARLEVTGGDAKMNANLLVAKNANIKGITGINGDTLSGTALYVNAGVAINGIRVKDPVDNYVLYAEKSGENNGVYISSSTTTSGSGAIAGVASGTATGVEAYGSLNNGLYAQSDSAAAVYAVSNSSLGIYAETGDPASYAGYFNGDVFSVGIFSSSDARLKNNIKDFGNAMQLIGTLKPKNYDYKRDGDYASLNLPHGNHYGLIAQDLEKVLPNLVKETSINIKNHKKVGVGIEKGFDKGHLINYKAVNYTELIPIMIKGMQEQESKAQQQTENIKQLQAKIKQQDAKIEALITLVEKLTTGAEATVADNSVTLSSATLEQNAPNPPVNHATRISYSIPKSATKAELQITDNSGKAIKRIALINHGKGQLNIDTTGLTAGTYSYTLLVDGKVVETKKMVVIE